MPLPQLWLEHDACQFNEAVAAHGETVAKLNAEINAPLPDTGDARARATVRRRELLRVRAEVVEEFVVRSDRFWFGRDEADARQAQRARSKP